MEQALDTARRDGDRSAHRSGADEPAREATGRRAERAGRRIVVLASGGGSNLQAVLDACAAGRIDGHVVAVVSDREDAGALDRAWNADVAAIHVGVDPGEERRRYDARLAEVVADLAPDLVVLAGWMRILTMAFLGRFPQRVVNLHPALPGDLPGVRAIERAWDEARAGCRTTTGVMVHLVPDEGIDDGPVLDVAEVPIHPEDTLDTLRARIHATEHELLVTTLAALCSGSPNAGTPNASSAARTISEGDPP